MPTRPCSPAPCVKKVIALATVYATVENMKLVILRMPTFLSKPREAWHSPRCATKPHGSTPS